MSEPNFSAFDQPGSPAKSELIPASSGLPGRSGSTMLLPRSGNDRIAKPAAGMDPMALLKSLRRRWVLALSVGSVVGVLVGVFLVLVVPPVKYTTRSVLQVSTHPPKVMFSTQDLLSDYRTFQNTQSQLIKSPYVLGPALRNEKVSNLAIIKAQVDPAEWLEKNIEVTFPSGSELLTIGMTSSNPDDLEPIVNSVVEAYRDTVVEEEQKARVARLEQLKTLWATKQAELKLKRKSIKDLSTVVGTDDKSTAVLKQSFQLENLHFLEQELFKIQSDRRQYNPYMSLIEKKENRGGQAVPSMIARPSETTPTAEPSKGGDDLAAAVEAQLAAHPHAAGLQEKLGALERKVRKLKNLARSSDDPALNAARSELHDVRLRLEDHRGRIRDSIVAAKNSGTGEPGVRAEPGNPSNVITLRDKIEMLKTREGDLKQEIDKYREAMATLNSQTMDLQLEKDEIELFDATAQKIGAEVEALQVELEAPQRIKLRTKAEPPRKKDMAKQYLICGGAAFGAFAIAMLSVSFWEMRAMRIDSVDEVVNHLGLAIVGALPALPNRSGKMSKAEDQRWQGLLVESIDATRTMLLHASRVNSTRAVMITSAMKGEGKTSLAAHLATSLARSGRKTLLIDCDLRRPRLHELFDVARVPGLCELLRGEAEVNDVIRPTPADDLNMIPAGHCDGLALQAIAQDGVRDILNVLKKRYDFIIIDSAPVLPVVDTMLLSQQVDAVLFSIMRDVSRVPHVQAAHERLASLGVKMLGAVVSAAERRDYMHMDNYEYETAEKA
jgi:succinoglycan biosynthesis transport protein ExoP